MQKVSYRKADVEGFNILYREAGPTDAQPLLLSHGFPGQERSVLPAAGAAAFERDMPGAVACFLETGHFASETHAAEIAAAIRDFLASLQSWRTRCAPIVLEKIRRARRPRLRGNSGAGAQTRCIRAGMNGPTRRRWAASNTSASRNPVPGRVSGWCEI